MVNHPFPLLRRFQDLLSIAFLTKADAVKADADIGRILGSDRIASLWQMHGNRTVVMKNPTSRTEQADGIATDVHGLTLTVRWADCQNFLILEPDRRVICLVHAGWRGMKAKALTRAFETLKNEWGIDPKNVRVGAGPSLCRRCAAFSNPRDELPELAAFITGNTVDLQAAADAELTTIGVLREHIDRSPDCTKCRPDLYWSYRGGDREAVKGGWANCLATTIIG
ncbi:MAG: polyphenol oxidase family protein [Candidatus Peribacteraceae bacterium]|nr:polyphenol oxidase family protein [Candidatus Peribacteraceae bacterium]